MELHSIIPFASRIVRYNVFFHKFLFFSKLRPYFYWKSQSYELDFISEAEEKDCSKKTRQNDASELVAARRFVFLCADSSQRRLVPRIYSNPT